MLSKHHSIQRVHLEMSTAADIDFATEISSKEWISDDEFFVTESEM